MDVACAAFRRGAGGTRRGMLRREEAGGCLKQHEGVGVEVTAWGRVTLKLTRRLHCPRTHAKPGTWSRGLRRSGSC